MLGKMRWWKKYRKRCIAFCCGVYVQVCSCFCTTAICLVSRFSRFRSTLSSPNSSHSHSLLFVIQSGMGRGEICRKVIHILSQAISWVQMLLCSLRGRKWLKNQRFIFTLGKCRITVLHLLALRRIRINVKIRLHGKYCIKYNVYECERRLWYRTYWPFKIHHVSAQLLW